MTTLIKKMKETRLLFLDGFNQEGCNVRRDKTTQIESVIQTARKLTCNHLFDSPYGVRNVVIMMLFTFHITCFNRPSLLLKGAHGVLLWLTGLIIKKLNL